MNMVISYFIEIILFFNIFFLKKASEWKKVGNMKILTKTKKQAGIILNDDIKTILPCSSYNVILMFF